MVFVSSVESKNISEVMHMVKNGANVNANYLGVFPLNLAIELGDCDMAAVLLTAGADPLLQPNGKRAKNAVMMCEAMLEDKKCKFRTEAAIVLELINDPEKLKERFEDLQERRRLQAAKDWQRVVNATKMFFFFILLAVIYYLVRTYVLPKGTLA